MTFYQSLASKRLQERPRSSAGSFLLLVLLALSFALARLAAVPPPLPVAGAGFRGRQGLHAQDLVDLPEGEQPQGVLGGGAEKCESVELKLFVQL